MIIEQLHISRRVSSCNQESDVLRLRLVCKRLAKISNEIAFRSLNFIQNEGGLRRLAVQSESTLSSAVREMRCYFKVLDADWTESPNRISGEPLSEEKVRKHQNYYQEGSSMNNDHQLPTLRSILPKFGGLRSIHLARIWDLVSDKPMDIPSERSKSPVGSRLFEVITDALAESKLQVEELSLGNFYFNTLGADHHGFSGVIQGLDPAYSEKYSLAFWNLKCLRIGLPWVLPEGEALNFAGLLALIRSGPFLEELHLAFRATSLISLPSSFLRGLALPALQLLDLYRVTFDAPECLLQLLVNHASTMKSIRFCGLSLRTGSWQTVFLRIRENLRIESSDMRDFCVMNHNSTKQLYPRACGQPTAFHQSINNFIQNASKINPFSVLDADLQRYFTTLYLTELRDRRIHDIAIQPLDDMRIERY